MKAEQWVILLRRLIDQTVAGEVSWTRADDDSIMWVGENGTVVVRTRGAPAQLLTSYDFPPYVEVRNSEGSIGSRLSAHSHDAISSAGDIQRIEAAGMVRDLAQVVDTYMDQEESYVNRMIEELGP